MERRFCWPPYKSIVNFFASLQALSSKVPPARCGPLCLLHEEPMLRPDATQVVSGQKHQHLERKKKTSKKDCSDVSGIWYPSMPPPQEIRP